MTEDQRFKVGDLCIFQNAMYVFSRNGMECVVERPYGTYKIRYPHPITGVTEETGYVIRFSDGDLTMADPCQLRLKRPPAEPLARWEDCVWRPSRERVS